MGSSTLGFRFSGDDIIIGKSTLIKKTETDGYDSSNQRIDALMNKIRKDCSTSLKHSETGKID
jgi:DNA-directed RNA polymerase beta subunit